MTRAPFCTTLVFPLFALVLATSAIASGRSAATPTAQSMEPAAAPRMLPSTFALTRAVEDSRFARVVGRWKAGGTEIVLLPRASGRQDATPLLFGAVPRGRHEGVLSLTPGDEGTWHGRFVDASKLASVDATISTTGRSLELRISGRAPIRFEHAGTVDTRLVESISVICHRGLSLGRREFMNSLTAIKHSWAFGCSGVELDITIPYSERREPLPGSMRVHHPRDLSAELTGLDSVAVSSLVRAPKLDAALAESHNAGVPFIYLDPKIRWLVKRHSAAARQSLESIVAAATTQLRSAAGQTIVIGSETSGPNEGADVLAELRRARMWPENLVWAFEITRGTNLETSARRLTDARRAERPEIVSLNLLRLDGGGGGLLRWFVSTIPLAMEQAFARALQPRIYWTAQNESQFDRTLRVIQRMQSSGSREVGIITPYPHRLVFHLATSRLQ